MVVRRKWPRWLVPSCSSKPSFVRSSGVAITPGSASLSQPPMSSSRERNEPTYLIQACSSNPVCNLCHHCKDGLPPCHMLYTWICKEWQRCRHNSKLAGMELLKGCMPALLTSTSRGRPPSRALLAKLLILDRSARSKGTASTLAPGCSALYTGPELLFIQLDSASFLGRQLPWHA